MHVKWLGCFATIYWLVLAVSSSNIGGDRQDIHLSDDGGYTDLLIAISDRIPEDLNIILYLQKYFTEASRVLLRATKNRLYFKNMTILVPPSWTNHPTWLQPEEEQTYSRARVLVAESNSAYGDIPYTLQPGGCGVEGDYIHFTPDYLTLNKSNDLPYRPAKRITREFSKLKWGLFDEDIPTVDKETPRFYRANDQLQGVGCVASFNFTFKNVEHCQTHTLDGAFAPPCDYAIEHVSGTASMLSFDYVDNVLEFCTNDREGGTAHNTVAENLQNKNCDGRSAWEVMNTLNDFAIDYNTTRNDVIPPDPEFRIVQKMTPTTPAPTSTTVPTTTVSNTTSPTVSLTTASSTSPAPDSELECKQDIVCLCLDVSGSMGTNNRIGVMSESVKVYILEYLRDGAAVGIVSFSSSAYPHADMTEITSSAVRDHLVGVVPSSDGGGTDIAAGLDECHRILRNYAGPNIGDTRIVLLSDGDGTVGNSIDNIISDEIIMDTVLYEQGGYLTDRAAETGGVQFFASDEGGQVGLAQFFADSASRGCEPGHSDAVLGNDAIAITSGEEFYNGTVDVDITIGVDTQLVFKYSADINVTVFTTKNLAVNYTRNEQLRIITASIDGVVEGSIHYVIRKEAALSTEVTVVVTVSSSPVPGVEQIVVSNRINGNNIQFSPSTKVVGYLGVFQGLSPVLQLAVAIKMEQPDGSFLTINYVDDGTGVDAVPYDGIYTGFAAAHQIGGGGGSYYGLTISITGEGVKPGQGTTGSRRKRCVDCDSLGNVTRSASGGVLVINGWQQVEDTTPPEKITDLRVVSTTSDGELFTFGWTAPGDDLNIGTAAGYEFGVGSDATIGTLVVLTSDAILTTNLSTFLVEAGGSLELQVNISKITPAMLGLDPSANVSTRYFRIRTYDAVNNYADWSNPASASYVSPDSVAAIVARSIKTTMPSETTTPSETTLLMDTSTIKATTSGARALVAAPGPASLLLSAAILGIVSQYGLDRLQVLLQI